MSFGLFRKLLRCLGISAFLWLALPSTGWTQTFGTPCAVPCAPCGSHHCPPAFKYTWEGPPRIHWHRGCPHPICDPCNLPHWGYYEACWNVFPFPPNWGHCPTPPPAAFVHLNPMVNPHFAPQGGQRNTFGAPLPAQPMPMPMTSPPSGIDGELNQPRQYEQKRPGLN